MRLITAIRFLLFSLLFLSFTIISEATQKKSTPESFSSYQQLQEYFNYNARFENDVLIKASQNVCVKKGSFKVHKLINGKRIALETGESLGLKNYISEDSQIIEASSGWTIACCWGYSPCYDGIITIDGVPHAAKQISDTIIGYNVAPYTNITHIVSVAPGETVTKSTTVTTTTQITWSADFSLEASLFEFLKVTLGLTRNSSTTETISKVYSSKYTFEPGCDGYSYKSYYVAATADLHRIKYLAAPIARTLLMTFYDCSRSHEVELEIMVPHQVSFYVCGYNPY